MIEIFKASKVQIGPKRPKAPIRAIQLLSAPDLQADSVEDGPSSRGHHPAFTGVEDGVPRVVRGRRRPRNQELPKPVSLEVGGLDLVKDRRVSMTFPTSIVKDIIVPRNSKMNDDVGV